MVNCAKSHHCVISKALNNQHLHAIFGGKIPVDYLFLRDVIHATANLNSKLNQLPRSNCLWEKQKIHVIARRNVQALTGSSNEDTFIA